MKDSFCFKGGNMKKDVTKMLKCRAIFLQSLATLNNGIIRFDETLDSLLDGFFDSYIRGNFDKFSLIYCFQLEKGKLVIHEEDEWELELYRYLNYFLYQDDKKILKLYDDVGDESIDKISELAEMFYQYIDELYSMKTYTLKS